MLCIVLKVRLLLRSPVRYDDEKRRRRCTLVFVDCVVGSREGVKLVRLSVCCCCINVCMYICTHIYFFVFVFGLGYVSWRVVLFCFVGWLCVYACTYICMFRCTYVCFENEMWVCKSLSLFLLFVCCLCCLSVLFSLLIFSVGFIIVVVVASFSDA